MKTEILRKCWNQPHPARYGAPAGVDECFAVFTHHEFNGRTYQTETVGMNGVITQSGEYPAFTPYALKRLASFA